MLLIYTTSYDTTVDLLLNRMGREECFRYNFDLWRDYDVTLDSSGFRIEDPTGRSIDDRRMRKVLWRKPFKTRDLGGEVEITDQDIYCEEELWYALREIINLLWAAGKVVLVEPRADLRVGKFVQAQVARRHFQVPPDRFRCGSGTEMFADRQVVAKSLTSESIGGAADKNVLYATKVSGADLGLSFPWMVQEYVAAERDVTVACVRDRLFAFELDRSPFLDRTIDWRELPVDAVAGDWQPHELRPAQADAIFRFMKDLNLHFGRLDFLCAAGEYRFLEVNPNGQWAWLDADGKHGLLDKIVQEISPFTPCHPIPTPLHVTL